MQTNPISNIQGFLLDVWQGCQLSGGTGHVQDAQVHPCPHCKPDDNYPHHSRQDMLRKGHHGRQAGKQSWGQGPQS